MGVRADRRRRTGLGAEQFARPLNQRMLAPPPAAVGGAKRTRAGAAAGAGGSRLVAAKANSTRIGCPVTSAKRLLEPGNLLGPLAGRS